MSVLLNAAIALVEDAKVRDYLLNPANPQNQGKAGQFGRFGFTRVGWAVLAAALGRHPVQNQVVKIMQSQHGAKHVVECTLMTPDRRNPCLRSVWIIESGQSPPGWQRHTDANRL